MEAVMVWNMKKTFYSIFYGRNPEIGTLNGHVTRFFVHFIQVQSFSHVFCYSLLVYLVPIMSYEGK